MLCMLTAKPLSCRFFLLACLCPVIFWMSTNPFWLSVYAACSDLRHVLWLFKFANFLVFWLSLSASCLHIQTFSWLSTSTPCPDFWLGSWFSSAACPDLQLVIWLSVFTTCSDLWPAFSCLFQSSAILCSSIHNRCGPWFLKQDKLGGLD